MVEAALAAFVHAPPPLPEAVRAAGRLSLLNMIGCAIGGSGEAAIDKLCAMLPTFSGPAACTLIGRSERGDALWAAYVNAASANIFDYDDTHIPTVIHPSAPVAAAVLALAEFRPVSGKVLLESFILGVEVACHLGLALHPVHYARGWHITSTCGAFGAAMGCARLLDLGPRQIIDAMGHALAQNGGSVETLGTMSKSLSVGLAARSGLMAALLAEQGFTGPVAPISGKSGFLNLHSDQPDMNQLAQGIGREWEILRNSFKPYPCGVVLNPVLEACLALHAEAVSGPVAAIDLTGHPLLRQRTDRPGVTSGRLAQVSAQHAAAVSLLKGRADLWAFSDEAVALPDVKRLGAQVRFHDDPAMPLEAAEIRISMADGRVFTHRVDAARGGLRNPLSKSDLVEKLKGQITYRDLDIDTARLDAAIDEIESAASGTAFLALTTDRPDRSIR